jgi:hypothetical protein
MPLRSDASLPAPPSCKLVVAGRAFPLGQSPKAVSLTAADGEDDAKLGSCCYVSNNQIPFQCRRLALTVVRMIGRKASSEIGVCKGSSVWFLEKDQARARVCVCVCVCVCVSVCVRIA